MIKHPWQAGCAVLLLTLVAGCGAPAQTLAVSPTPEVSATPAIPAATPTVNPTLGVSAETPTVAGDTPTPPAELSAGPLADVPRNRTVVLSWGLNAPVGVTNPLNSLGYTHQEGNNLLWEGLSYFAIVADKEIPWLALSMTYTKPDFTELTIKLNPLAQWSDGQPVTAQDVLYTFQSELDDPTQLYHTDFTTYVQSLKALDTETVVLSFKVPAPRFKFEDLTLKFDTGVPILPAHALAQQPDRGNFPGGLDLPHSGPYNLMVWNKDQKVYDLRPDWWAVRAGLIAPPAAQRVVFLNAVSDNNVMALRTVNGEFDATADMRSAVIASVLKQNPKITSYTGGQPPYGYLDWWPQSLFVDTRLAPYDDPNVRHALSLAIDRDRIDALLYQDAPVATIYPFPLYPALQRFADSPAVKALEAQYQPRKFDLAESARLMTAAGFTKNADGFWARNGQTLDATVNGFSGIHDDIAPVLVEMLRTAGFNSQVYFGADVYDHMASGQAGLYLWGHGASLIDPFATLDLYNGRHSQPPGTHDDNNLSRYNNPAYDKIVDAMAVLSADDPQFQALAAQAMGIYWRDVIDIPIIQWLHRIPYNQTYWTNWPTQANLALGTNGAFWAETGMLVITSLKPVE